MILAKHHIIVDTLVLKCTELILLQNILHRVIIKFIIFKVWVFENQIKLELPRYAIRLCLRLTLPSFVIFCIKLTLTAFTYCDLNKAGFFSRKHPLNGKIYFLRAKVFSCDTQKVIGRINIQSRLFAWNQFESIFCSLWNGKPSLIFHPLIFILCHSQINIFIKVRPYIRFIVLPGPIHADRKVKVIFG